MSTTTAIQTATALIALFGQLTPLARELKAAIESNNDAKIEDLLRRLQAVNDQLGKA